MEYLVGTIAAFAFNFAPSQFVLCDGKSLPIAQYQQLYTYIGNRFGGDATSFNVPDLSGAKLLPSLAYYIATSGMNPQF